LIKAFNTECSIFGIFTGKKERRLLAVKITLILESNLVKCTKPDLFKTLIKLALRGLY